MTKSGLKPTWLKGDVELPASERVQPHSVDTKHMLTIKESELDDQSSFTIIVNETLKATAKLTVEGKVYLDHSLCVANCSQKFLD